MKLSPFSIGLALASSAFLTTPALAQYGGSAPAQPAAPAAPAQKPDAAPEKKFNISAGIRKDLIALQKAVNEKNGAAIPGLVAAAQAKAKTADDRYAIGKLQLKAAADANDNAAIATAVDAIIASGADISSEKALLYSTVAKINYNAKNYDKAGAAFEQALQADPNNLDSLVLLAETRQAQKRTPEAVSLIQKAIAVRTAAGQKAEENWYKRAVAIAFEAKLPSAVALSRDWVKAYPAPKSWRDSLIIYQSTSQLDNSSLIDAMRLAQATGALTGENDYFRFANTLIIKGYPGEAKAVLEQGFAAKAIDRSKPTFSQLYAQASAKSQGDRASLEASATAARAAPDAKKAMVIADAYYGYGDYTKAADLYRAALGKSGVDKDLANLRLGMSLARSGDKAGATAALNAAGGAQAEVAKYWLTYLATKA